MLSIVDRGADLLASQSHITPDLGRRTISGAVTSTERFVLR